MVMCIVIVVYIVKMTQNWIILDGNPFFGLIYEFEITLKISGMSEIKLLVTKIQF